MEGEPGVASSDNTVMLCLKSEDAEKRRREVEDKWLDR
jgi:hypothetical protein